MHGATQANMQVATHIDLLKRLGSAVNKTSTYQPPKILPQKTQQVTRAHSEPTIKYQVHVNDKVYKVLRRLGTGGSAKVYEGFDPQTAMTVAIKIINMAKADPKTQQGYFNEISLLRQLSDCPGVVRMYDSEYKSKCQELIVVMEKGDADLAQVLDSYYKRKGAKKIDGVTIKFYWRELLLAVREIHKRGIVHADLKPVNFIFVRSQIKIIDFGIAHAIAPDSTSIIRDYQIGTINYMAPETLRNRAEDRSFHQSTQQHQASVVKRATVIKYNDKADIWSLGCILYNLVYGSPPFDKYPDLLTKAQAIVDPQHVIELKPLKNQHLLDCIKSCLRYQPERRLSAEELLSHPYLADDLTNSPVQASRGGLTGGGGVRTFA